MIKLIKKGNYKLIETKGQVKILILDNENTFAWIWAKSIGEILVSSYNPHRVDHVLAMGKYRMYTVRNVPDVVDLTHLELAVGQRHWQSYLLPTGLPDDTGKRRRIIPTTDAITPKILRKRIYFTGDSKEVAGYIV